MLHYKILISFWQVYIKLPICYIVIRQLTATFKIAHPHILQRKREQKNPEVTTVLKFHGIEIHKKKKENISVK